MRPIVGYWAIRGFGNPIRFLLEYAGVDYEDKRYQCGPPPNFERPEYLADSKTLGLDFPNMPFYIDDDIKLTQSQVILRYLGRKHNLAGDNEAEYARADLLSTQLYDFSLDFKRLIFSPDFAKRKDAYLQDMPAKIKQLVDFLGPNKFAVGDKVTWADFMLFEYLEGCLYFNPDFLNNFPTLDDFHKRMLALEPLDKYFKSDRFIKFPFGGAPAYVAGPYSDLLSKK